jgi:hypothetical protein
MPSWVLLCPHPLQPDVPRGALPLCSLEWVIRELAYALAKAGQEVRVLAPAAARRRLDGFDLLPTSFPWPRQPRWMCPFGWAAQVWRARERFGASAS